MGSRQKRGANRLRQNRLRQEPFDLFQKNDSMLEMIRVSNLFFMVFAFVMQMTVNRLESPTPTVISQAMGLAEAVQQSSEKLS